MSRTEPALALKLEKDSATKLKSIGVKVVERRQSDFMRAATPVQDQLAAELGPHAVKLLKMVRELEVAAASAAAAAAQRRRFFRRTSYRWPTSCA